MRRHPFCVALVVIFGLLALPWLALAQEPEPATPIEETAVEPVSPSDVNPPNAEETSEASEPSLAPVGRTDPTGMSFIASLRSRPYGGGAIERVRVVADYPTFTRYLIRYPSDDLTIQGFMNVPKDVEPPYRAVVVAHGFVNPDAYPLTPYSTPYADALARAGFLVVHPNYRNHSGSDRGPNPFRAGYTIDVLNLVALLKASPEVRPDAIGVFGHSMGGEVTTKAVVVSPDIRAAVLYGAMGADAWENWRLINNTWAGGWFLFEGPFSPWRDREAFALASPINFLDYVQAPIQIHHGTADDTVPLAWSIQLADALKGHGKTVELFKYPGAPHSFWTGSPAYQMLMERTNSFFMSHLGQ